MTPGISAIAIAYDENIENAAEFEFDARPWFEQASFEQLVRLAKHSFRNCPEANDVYVWTLEHVKPEGMEDWHNAVNSEYNIGVEMALGPATEFMNNRLTVKYMADKAVSAVLGESDEEMMAHLANVAQMQSYWLAYNPHARKHDNQAYFDKKGNFGIRPVLFTAQEKAERMDDPRWENVAWERAPYHIATLYSESEDIMGDVVQKALEPRLYYAYLTTQDGTRTVWMDIYGDPSDKPVPFTHNQMKIRMDRPHWQYVKWVPAKDVKEGMEDELVNVALNSPWMKTSREFNKKRIYDRNPWIDAIEAMGHGSQYAYKVGEEIRQVSQNLRRLDSDPALIDSIWDRLARKRREEGMPEKNIEMLHRLWSKVMGNYNDPTWIRPGEEPREE